MISLIRQDIQYFAMHTNYDVLGMADLSADYLKLPETVFSTEEPEGLAGRVESTCRRG